MMYWVMQGLSHSGWMRFRDCIYRRYGVREEVKFDERTPLCNDIGQSHRNTLSLVIKPYDEQALGTATKRKILRPIDIST